MKIDPRSVEFAQNPYPTYAWLRREEPVYYIEPLKLYWVTRYADVSQVLTDPRFGKRNPTAPQMPPLPPEYQKLAEIPPSLILQDPPDHTRLRGLVSKAFTPKAVERLRGRIEAIAHELLDRVQGEGRMDLVADFAFPLPATVIAEMLGVPRDNLPRFHQWSRDFIRSGDASQAHLPGVREAGLKAQVEMAYFFEELARQRRAAPEDDMISALVQVEEQGERLSMGELVSTCILLLIAGHETTTNLIGNGVLTLLTHPEQLGWLRAHPEAMGTAVEELLRYESPVQRFGRFVQEDLELGGRELKRGAHVSVLFASANRDEAVFANPDELDLTRDPNPHLAFGKGIHFCLGAPLARIEGPVALRVLLERMPNLRLDPDSAYEWAPQTLVRGLRRLPVRF
ncbi:MAG: cytochrome P450 [Bacillota bacterium]